MVAFGRRDVLQLRMASLLLARRQSPTPAAVVTWLGAMQSQDLASGEWSFGVRCPGLTQAEVHQATVDRSILRTWPMRGTVHFVPPRDARWMLEVAGARALDGAQKRREYLGLTEEIVNRGAEVLAAALSGGGCLTRAECVALLVDAGIHTASQHGYHLLWYASQIGVTCIGPQRGKEQTFVLLDEWVPDPHRLSRDEALSELAIRYFRGRGPATRQDFAGWTGLMAADTKRGIELASDALTPIDVDGTTMLMAAPLLDNATEALAEDTEEDLHLLPGFDEYMLGYKDRSAMIGPDHMKRVIPGSNGVFMSTIVDRGRVIGLWRRKIKSRSVDIAVAPFEPLSAPQRAGIDRSAREYAAFVQLEPSITISE